MHSAPATGAVRSVLERTAATTFESSVVGARPHIEKQHASYDGGEGARDHYGILPEIYERRLEMPFWLHDCSCHVMQSDADRGVMYAMLRKTWPQGALWTRQEALFRRRIAIEPSGLIICQCGEIHWRTIQPRARLLTGEKCRV